MNRNLFSFLPGIVITGILLCACHPVQVKNSEEKRLEPTASDSIAELPENKESVSVKKQQYPNTTNEPVPHKEQKITNKEVPDEPAPSIEELMRAEQSGVKEEHDPGGVDDLLLQKENPVLAGNQVNAFCETMPVFPSDLEAYLKSHLRYPKLAFENKIEGKVNVQFVINRDGKIDKNSIQIVGKKPEWGFGEEAIRVISEMPAWIPGKQNSQAVKVRYTLPVVFKP